MASPALDVALADIDTTFNGFASSHGSGCPPVPRARLFEVPDHFDDHTAAMRRLLRRRHGRWPTVYWGRSATALTG
ncbi:hypothetical protein ACFZC7_21675 [Streptomyces massasporeus]|uniref:hypothetical protein n=1 Tax=Streptomyces massasporeus TaxID=67324 RepID=UPI0036EA8B26